MLHASANGELLGVNDCHDVAWSPMQHAGEPPRQLDKAWWAL
jgi:hypothetical protein